MALTDAVAFSRLTNAMPVDITVGAATGWAIVDTGNPWVLLDPTTFPAAASLSAQTGGSLSSPLVISSSTLNGVYAFGSNAGDDPVESMFQIDGNVGCTVLCGLVPSLNYRDVTFTLGGTAAPSGLMAPVSVPFSLEGGGTESGVVLPKSRIVVDVSIEGTTHSMILDTGASSVTVSQSVYATLTADGRTQISGGQSTTTSGMSATELTRVSSIVLGGAEVDGVVVAHDASFDMNLAAVSSDVGHTIEGSLGGTFLHDFYVTIDYAQQTLTFARYTDVSFALDFAQRIGITLGIEPDGSYGVASATGDAASKGVQTGDFITGIDGQVLTSLDELQVSTLLFGPVGSTRLVTFGQAATLAGMKVPILVEENLPLAGK